MAEQDNEEPESLSRFATYGRFGDVARRTLVRMEELIVAMPPEPPFAPEGPEHETWVLYQHETGKHGNRSMNTPRSSSSSPQLPQS